MNEFVLIISVATLPLLILAVIEITRGKKAISFLKDISPHHEFEGDKVSIVIPAKNEAKSIEAALISVLAQDYNNFEVIAIDDRSTDETGKILDRISKNNHHLRVYHLTKLPKGWLGKNHALYYGAKIARGHFLLFADADVEMAPSALRRAVYFMKEQNLDHMVVGPQVKISSKILKIVLLSFSVSFMLFFQPWKAKNPKSKRSIGGGAFSLMRRKAYDAVGTMKAIPMCVADDLKLGQLIKKHGFRQEFLAGGDMIFLEWYANLSEMIAGLTKNSFVVLGFSMLRVIASTVILSVIYLWPLIAFFVTTGITQLLYFLILLLILSIYWSISSFIRMPAWVVFGFPIGVVINIYIIWKSAWTTLKNKGILWRDTYYPLDELKNSP